MGNGIRAFIVTDDDGVLKIPFTRLDRLLSGDSRERMPEFASRRIRYALIFVETEQRVAVRVRNAEFGVLTLNELGKRDPHGHDTQLKESMALFGSFMDDLNVGAKERPDSNVVNARHTFQRRQYDHKYRWKPSEAVLEAIRTAIFRN